jgi:excinuclease ABC subunit C
MQEVLGRRFSPKSRADERFARADPDLLVVDGGKPQLTAAMTQLEELGVTNVPVCGLAKSDEEVFVPWDETPVVLPSGSASLYLIKQVRDESHRFAITFHRELRTKAQSVSILDDVEGVGPKRKRAIMRRFGSLRRLRAASVEEIASVPGVPESVATDVWQTLRAWEEEAATVSREAAGSDAAGEKDEASAADASTGADVAPGEKDACPVPASGDGVEGPSAVDTRGPVG